MKPDRTGRAVAAVKNVMFLSAVDTPFLFVTFSLGVAKRKFIKIAKESLYKIQGKVFHKNNVIVNCE